MRFRWSWRARALLAAALAVGFIAAVPAVREPVLRAAGRTLVVDDPIAPADMIVVSLDSGGAGVLEAADLVNASRVIEDAGFSIYDDVVHGFGGGYWPPVLGRNSRAAAGIPDMRLEANMTLVVQPNVITLDETAGVQLGEMVRVTSSGCERMHAAPWGLLRIDP